MHGLFKRVTPHRKLDVDLKSSSSSGTKNCWKGTNHESYVRVGCTGTAERAPQPLKQPIYGYRLTILIHVPQHQHQPPSDPSALIGKRAVSGLIEPLCKPAICRLERSIRPINVPEQGEELLHTRVITMGNEILKLSLDQMRLGFEIVVLAPGTMADAGVWMCSGRAL